MEPKDEPIVPWRETHQHTITPFVINQGEEKYCCDYRVQKEDILDKWNALIDYLNLVQGEIKSVTVYERGRTEHDTKSQYETNPNLNVNYGFGYAWGWGVSIPDFIVVIYEQVNYIPYSTYQQKMQQCRNKLHAHENQQKLKTLRSELASARSAMSELESEVSDLRERSNSLKNAAPEEKSGWMGKSWLFDGIEYKSKEQADKAYNEALAQLEGELSSKESRLADTAKTVDSLQSQIESLESDSQTSE